MEKFPDKHFGILLNHKMNYKKGKRKEVRENEIYDKFWHLAHICLILISFTGTNLCKYETCK